MFQDVIFDFLGVLIGTLLFLLIVLIRERIKGKRHATVDKEMKAMFISSKGGHFSELMQLKPVMKKTNYMIVTEPGGGSDEDLKKEYGEKIKFLVYGTKLNPIKYIFVLLANCFISLGIYLVFRPHVIITTGTHTAGPMCCIGKILGSKIIYIETFANKKTKTDAGRLIYHIAHRFVVQWDDMEELYPKAENWGWIY